MRFLLLFFSFLYSLNADFISNYEYGKMLYENPRGISCKKCHGDAAKDIHISSFRKNGRDVDIVAPALKNISRESLEKGLKRGKRFMPKYRLTEGEIDALYIFLNIN